MPNHNNLADFILINLYYSKFELINQYQTYILNKSLKTTFILRQGKNKTTENKMFFIFSPLEQNAGALPGKPSSFLYISDPILRYYTKA
jgi:hypothetical protein